MFRDKKSILNISKDTLELLPMSMHLSDGYIMNNRNNEFKQDPDHKSKIHIVL